MAPAWIGELKWRVRRVDQSGSRRAMFEARDHGADDEATREEKGARRRRRAGGAAVCAPWPVGPPAPSSCYGAVRNPISASMVITVWDEPRERVMTALSACESRP